MDQINSNLSPEWTALTSSIQEKKACGKKLTAVEAHIFRCLGRKSFFSKSLFKRTALAPSVLDSATAVLGVFLEPLPILFVLAVIFVAAAPSTATLFGNYSSSPEDAANSSGDELYEALALDEAHTIEENSSAPALVFEDPTPVKTASGLVFATAFGSQQESPIATAPSQTPQENAAQNSAKNYGALKESVNLEKHDGLIEFISGVIAVYCPTAGDSGAIARNIVELATREGLDPLYIASVVAVESRFKSNARSHVGAQGLMQLLPGTARDVHEKVAGKQGTSPKLSDPATNITLGIGYLKEMHARYRGNRYLALAAYNWGPANVDQMLKIKARLPKSVEQYSISVIELSKRWQGHFKKAREHADDLANMNLPTANS